METIEKPGWHDRGYHPHLDTGCLVQHVVFRTFGSLPAQVVADNANLEPRDKARQIDKALDCSVTGRVFMNPDFATFMQSALRFFDGSRYDLQAWCVMPNHVHVVLVVYPDVLLGRVIKSWKHAVARHINKATGNIGAVFAKDYFDRYFRNLRQAEATLHYVEANPVKAGLCNVASDWQWSSAHHRARGWQPKHHHLPLFLE